ncbi:hypothetical protein HN51_047726, partial [Arachis hypogaea]
MFNIEFSDSNLFSIYAVDHATGGASIRDGEMELMLHRRILQDDGRGAGKALDELD